MHAEYNKIVFPSQICVGAVQRPFLADLWPCDPGPPLLPAHPFCGAQSNVQLHYDHVVTLAKQNWEQDLIRERKEESEEKVDLKQPNR